MLNHRLAVICLALFLGVSAFSSQARATDTPARRAAAVDSLEGGFRQSALPLLERVPGPDRDALAKRLSASFCQGCTPRVGDSPLRGATIRLPGWTMTSTPDGNSVTAESDRSHERARDIASQAPDVPSDSKLEGLARDFILRQLSGIVAFENGDELVASSIARNIEGGTDGRGALAQRIIASRILLTRRIAGTAVVGGGGAIAVTLANDGTALSFAYDWARYRTRSELQTMLSVGDLLARLQKVVAAETGTQALAQLIPSEQANYPYDLTDDTALESFECGYVDSGDPSRGRGAVIQPGCSYRALRVTKPRSGPSVRNGLAGAVPAGVTFEPDDHWPEATLLLGNHSRRAPAGRTAITPDAPDCHR